MTQQLPQTDMMMFPVHCHYELSKAQDVNNCLKWLARGLAGSYQRIVRFYMFPLYFYVLVLLLLLLLLCATGHQH